LRAHYNQIVTQKLPISATIGTPAHYLHKNQLRYKMRSILIN
jgi:hypothetical protein